jgi:hypothetical protein
MRIIMRPATRSAPAAISPPRPRSARCSASWSASASPTSGARRAAGGRHSSSSAPAAARSPPTRCGRCARRAGPPAVHFVETSPVLRSAQAERVPGARWHDDLASLPADGLCSSSPTNSSMPCRSASWFARALAGASGSCGLEEGRFVPGAGPPVPELGDPRACPGRARRDDPRRPRRPRSASWRQLASGSFAGWRRR